MTWFVGDHIFENRNAIEESAFRQKVLTRFAQAGSWLWTVATIVLALTTAS